MPESVPESAPASRRGFLAFITIVFGAVPVVGGLIAALRAALAPAATHKPVRIPLCRADQVPEQGIVERALSYQVRRGPSVENVARVVFVTRDPQSQAIIAMSGECTHLACPVHLAKEKDANSAPLQCPCHGGKFSPTGEVLDGPPPRPLTRLPLELPADGKGMIHVVTA